MNSLYRHLIAAGLVAGIGIGAIAQTQPAPQQPGTTASQAAQGQRGAKDPARMERMHKRMQERMAKRLDELKAQLRITPAQEGAWTTWTSALQPAARNFQRPDRAELARLTTPERIDRMKARRAARLAEMDKRLDATKVFYASLSSEQKAVFDAVGLRYLGHGGKGGHRGHGQHHHHRG